MIEKFCVEIRHRPILGQPIEDKHREFLSAAKLLPAPWGLVDVEQCVLPKNQAGNLGTTLVLNRFFGKGVKGYVTYAARSAAYLADTGEYDDYLIAEFNPARFDFGVLVDQVFPALILAFRAYRGAVFNDELALDDWGTIVETVNRTGIDVDGRGGVYRVNAMNFWDDDLCQRAFHKTSTEVVRLLGPLVPKAELLSGGAYVVCFEKFPTRAALEELGGRLKSVL
jgi:hypothetical protein